MSLLKALSFLLLLGAPISLSAQAEALFNNIQVNQSLTEVMPKLQSIAKETQLIEVAVPRFPLSAQKEAHLIAKGIRTSQGRIERAVFTFADDTLQYIEAHGNSYNTFTAQRSDTARTYMDYEVYFQDKLFLHKQKDIAWILSEGALHANLFTWENPYLKDGEVPTTAYTATIPEFILMGGTLEALQPVLEQHSTFTYLEELDGSDPNAQQQLNCFGIEYLGFPRKVEARFGDGQLNVVWILTGKGEENRIRQALIQQYGEPVFVNADWEIFHNWQVGLRKDKPEVLLMEQSIGLGYKTSYFKQ